METREELFLMNREISGITTSGWRPDDNTENVNGAVKSFMLLSLVQAVPKCKLNLTDMNSSIDFDGPRIQ